MHATPPLTPLGTRFIFKPGFADASRITDALDLLAWDPEKPRDYNNFNPFERNDEVDGR